MRISKRFKLNRTQAELDFVDVNTNRDLPLFLDPHFLARREDHWSIIASRTIRSFFGHFLALVASGEIDEARDLFDHLHEPNETCLGLSRAHPRGNGVGDENAQRIFESLVQSQAAKSGVLEDLEDCRIFVRGIGKDKLSDMVTNIIRGQLIEYTQRQCEFWGIPLQSHTPTGFCWNTRDLRWDAAFSDNLFVGTKRILLVPKGVVSYSKTYTPSRFHQHFVLNFLQHEHLRIRSSLVQTRRLKNGSVVEWVTKRDLVASGKAPDDKDSLARFTKAHPEVFREFKQADDRADPSLPLEALTDTPLDEVAGHLIQQLRSISPGTAEATEYHRTVVSILDFLFYPALFNPQTEVKIHGGRKRLDITFDNGDSNGFFFRLPTVSQIPCPFILVECKNYSRDISNPELDQITGRFSPNRGKVGIVVCRSIDNLQLFLARCRDTHLEQRGLVLPLTDDDLVNALEARMEGTQRALDSRLEEVYRIVALH